MDIHLNVWGIKTRLDGNENIAIQLREIESKDKIIGHLSRATAQALYDDLGKILTSRTGKSESPNNAPLG